MTVYMWVCMYVYMYLRICVSGAMRESERARQKKSEGFGAIYCRSVAVTGLCTVGGCRSEAPRTVTRRDVLGTLVGLWLVGPAYVSRQGARGRSHQITPPCEIDVSHHGARERAPAVGTDS